MAQPPWELTSCCGLDQDGMAVGQDRRPRVRDPSQAWKTGCPDHCVLRDVGSIVGTITGVPSGRQEELCGGSLQGSRWPQVGGTLDPFSKYVSVPTVCQGTALGMGESVVTRQATIYPCSLELRFESG